jgi:cytochrome c5
MKKLTVILIVGLLTACGSSKNSTATKNAATTADKKPAVVVIDPELAKAQAKVPGITMKELSQGRSLFIERCSNCHALKSPSDYTQQQWDPILVRMTMKANIYDNAQKLLIRNYLVANSK